MSNDIQLEDIVTHTNVLLEEQQAAANRSEQEGSPPRYTLVELLNVFGAAFNDDLRYISRLLSISALFLLSSHLYD